jgi:16S rRNA processing protein RimM
MNTVEYLNVGRLVGTHGVRGEVRVYSDTDFPDVRFAQGSSLLLVHPSLKEPLPLTVEKGRPHKSVWLVKFKEWDNINQAEPYKGGKLVVLKEDLAPVNEEEGEFYFHQIIGCTVVTTDGNGKEMLLPYIADVVKDVDIKERRITIEWMEGLD